MLLRGANAVGYTNYPDNVVKFFVRQAAKAGIDVFRIFDCLNWVENMRVAIDAVVEAGKICRGRHLLHRRHPRPGPRQIRPQVLRRRWPRSWKPPAPTSSASRTWPACSSPPPRRSWSRRCATRSACRSTSTPTTPRALRRRRCWRRWKPGSMRSTRRWTRCRGSPRSLASARWSRRCATRSATPGLDAKAIRQISFYWEAVRTQYVAFESDLRAGASEVYLHEMPGGQFTNLKEQARSLGLEARWHEVARTYADVNLMFGDIVKVTPSSKVVGDHGADDGRLGPDAGRRARPEEGHRLPRFGRADDARRSRPAAGAGGRRRCRRRF